MAKKGEAKKLKALNAPKTAKISRKESTWTVNTNKGPHKKNDSVALLLILRNIIKIGENSKEVQKILNAGEVKVNEKIVKDYSLPIGLLDVVTIDAQKLSFRILFDKKRRVVLKELKEASNEKIVKVTNKVATKKGIILGTNDGRTIKSDKAKVGDSLKISLPEGKVEKVLELKKGALVYITKGAHCSSTGKITEIIQGSISREKLVRIEIEGKEYETIEKNTMVIGDNKAELAELN